MSKAAAKGILLCMHALTHTHHSQVAAFIISLIPELSLLGNQSVIHHYLSSVQKAPEDSGTCTDLYTHKYTAQLTWEWSGTYTCMSVHTHSQTPWRCLCPLGGIKGSWWRGNYKHRGGEWGDKHRTTPHSVLSEACRQDRLRANERSQDLSSLAQVKLARGKDVLCEREMCCI